MKRAAAACGSELDRHHRMGFRIGISCLLPITCVHLQTNVLPALQGGMHRDPGCVSAPSGPCGALGAEKHRRSYRFRSDASKREEERRRTASGGTREEQNGLLLRSFQGTVKVVGMNPYIAVVTRLLCSIIYRLQLSNSRWRPPSTLTERRAHVRLGWHQSHRVCAEVPGFAQPWAEMSRQSRHFTFNN